MLAGTFVDQVSLMGLGSLFVCVCMYVFVLDISVYTCVYCAVERVSLA